MLDLERLLILQQIVPDAEELEAISKYSGDASKLGKAEQFQACVSSVKCLRPRINLALFKLEFPERVEGVKPNIKNMLSGCSQVADSESFTDLLMLVLAIGNVLNGGGTRGGAYGFKLDTLVKLADVKAATKGDNLLDFVIRTCQVKKPELMEWYSELSDVKAAAKLSLPDVEREMASLFQDLGKAKRAVAALQGAQGAETQALLMDEFLSSVETALEACKHDLTQLKAKSAKLLESYGEPKRTEFQDFLRNIVTFDAQWKRALLKVEKKANVAAKKSAAAEKKEAAKLKAALNPTAAAPAGFMDGLLGEMNGGGNMFAARRKLGANALAGLP